MSKHRKITVDGETYYWTVGRTHVKIQGMEAIPREHFPHTGSGKCSCGSFSCDVDIYCGVGPADIANAIKMHKKMENK